MATMRFEAVIGSTLADYVVSTTSGRQVATLLRNTWPREPWQLDFEGRQYLIWHKVATNKMFLNDYRYALMDGEATLASCLAKPATRTTDVTIGDGSYRLVRRGFLFSIRYALEDGNGRPLGTIAETSGFSLWRRRFLIEVPDTIGGPQAMFLFYLVANFSFR